MRSFDQTVLLEFLGAVGAHLEAAGESAAILVVGGAALNLRGIVQRTTRDVDVIAIEEAGRLRRPEFSPGMLRAVALVARDFDLDADWLNAAVGLHWDTGLPEGAADDIEWIPLLGLRVGLASRQTLVTLKLAAAVDHTRESAHTQDLIALAPTDAELENARRWVVEQDLNPVIATHTDEAIEHVRRHR